MVEDVVELDASFDASRFRDPGPLENVHVEVAYSWCALGVSPQVPDALNTTCGSCCKSRKAYEVSRTWINGCIIRIRISVASNEALTVDDRSGANAPAAVRIDIWTIGGRPTDTVGI